MSMFDNSRDYIPEYAARSAKPPVEPVWASIWRTLRQRRLMVGAAAVGGLLLGLVTGLSQKPEYEAVAILKLRPLDSALSSSLQDSETRAAQRRRTPDPVVRTRRIQSVAVNLIAAEAVVAGTPAASSSWKKQVRNAARRIETRVSADAQIVEIVSRASTPEMASELANALAVEVIFGESPEFARAALEDSAWTNATMLERLEALRRLDADLTRNVTIVPAPREQQASQAGGEVGADSSSALKAGSFNFVRVIRVARPDYESVPARWSSVLSSGGLSGLLLGLFAVAFEQATASRGFFDRSIRRPGEASQLLRLRELGNLPDVSIAARRGKMTPAGRAEASPLRAETVSFERPASQAAEHVRGLRTSLMAQEPGRTRLIVVTSPNPGEGKTTVAANLAASLAELGQKTVLVDAALRRPRLHQVFDVRNRRGLFDLLTSKRSDGVSLHRLLLKVSADLPLWLLPAGVAPHGGPGLLHEAAGRDLLEAIAAEFDSVIVDAPAVLMVSDARALARLADGVVLVVRAGVTDPAEALEAKQWLWEEGAHLLGVVLNSWDAKKHGARRHERYVAPKPIKGPDRTQTSAA